MATQAITLTSGRNRARINPHGARLEALSIHDLDIIVPLDVDGPVFAGAFPMIPWCGLLRGATFPFDGEAQQVTADWGDHALHGVVREADWSVVDGGANWVELQLALPASWPLGGVASCRLELQDDHLTLRWSVTAGPSGMPATVGWHPWFRRDLAGDALDVVTGFSAQWARSGTGEPLGRWRPVAPPPWDDSFLSATPVLLRWGHRLEVEVSGTGGIYSVYDAAEKGVVVATQTAPHETFGHTLEADAHLDLEVRLAWTLPAESSAS